MAIVGVHSFEAKIASRGYHICKRNSWSKARDGKEIKVQLETSQSSKKKTLTYTLVSFVLRRNISKDGKQ